MVATDDNIEMVIARMLQHKQSLGADITPEQYNHDIKDVARIDGLDAQEFLMEFKNRFKVDMTAFAYKKYFSNEGLWPWETLRSLFGKKGRPSFLSIKQLADIARAGRWPDEQPSS